MPEFFLSNEDSFIYKYLHVNIIMSIYILSIDANLENDYSTL